MIRVSREESFREQTIISDRTNQIDTSIVIKEYRNMFQSTKVYDIDDVIAQFIKKVGDREERKLLDED